MGDRFFVADQAKIAHDLAPEARIEQVQDGVGDAADVLIDGKPICNFGGVEGGFVVLWIAVAIEIPRGIDEGVHGVRLAARGTAAFRTGGVHKFRRSGERRATFTGEWDIFGKYYREILVRDGHNSVFGAVNDRDGRAPITL